MRVLIPPQPGLTKFHQEYNTAALYTPQNAEAFCDRKVIESNFGFDPRVDTIYAVALGSEGSPVLTRDNMLSWYDTYQQVVDMKEARTGADWKREPNPPPPDLLLFTLTLHPSIPLHFIRDSPPTLIALTTLPTPAPSPFADDAGVAISLTDVCYKTSDTCMVASILAFWDYNRTLIASRTDAQLTADIAAAGNVATEKSGQRSQLSQVAACNADGAIVALRMTFLLLNNKVPLPNERDDDPRADDWEYNRYL